MNMYEFCFSPTGGTERVAAAMVNELADEVTFVDLTARNVDFSEITLSSEDIALIAVPSYSGRVPAVAAERLRRIRGHGARAILVCVYGNRAYEDTLSELRDVVREAGFEIIAAVAAIAEHSIAHRYAAGRPDNADVEELRSFATRIRQKINNEARTEPQVPGNFPYRKADKSGIVPKATKECIQCGLCALKCPVGAIDVNDPKRVDKDICISCMRCVSICPHKARENSRLMLALVDKMLRKVCSERKSCELYIN